MGTQTDIADTIISMKADYVLSVKKNQPTLFSDVSVAMESLEYNAKGKNKAKLKAAGMYERTAEKVMGDMRFGSATSALTSRCFQLPTNGMALPDSV